MSSDPVPDFTPLAVRYSADVPAMAAFLDTLGLSRRTSTPDGGFVIFAAGRGLVMLHPTATALTGARAGSTELAFEVSDLDTTVAALAAAGLDAVVWDESYGRHAGVRDRHGDGIWINERQRDLYGYRAHDAAPNDVNLIAVRYSDDFAADRPFYARFGFRPRPGGVVDYESLDAVAPARGTLGLHAPNPTPAERASQDDERRGVVSADNPVAPNALIKLAFETREDLDHLAARLPSAGYGDVHIDEGTARNVQVIDPDGVLIEIHAAP